MKNGKHYIKAQEKAINKNYYNSSRRLKWA